MPKLTVLGTLRSCQSSYSELLPAAQLSCRQPHAEQTITGWQPALCLVAGRFPSRTSTSVRFAANVICAGIGEVDDARRHLLQTRTMAADHDMRSVEADPPSFLRGVDRPTGECEIASDVRGSPIDAPNFRLLLSNLDRFPALALSPRSLSRDPRTLAPRAHDESRSSLRSTATKNWLEIE